MAKGITISITRVVDHVRERNPDDPVFHSIWTGTEWVSLATTIWPARFEKYGCKPVIATTRVGFPPPGTITIDALRYRRTYREMRKRGVLQ